MADGQDDRTLVGLAALGDHPGDSAITGVLQGNHLALEMELPSVVLDGGTDFLDDAGQPVAADMGMGLVKDRRIRPMLAELGKHLGDVPALVASREELAVAESASPALAEPIVRVGIDDTAPTHLGDVQFALLDTLAPLDDHRLQADLQKP